MKAVSRLTIVAAVAILAVSGVAPVQAQNPQVQNPNFPSFQSTTGLACNNNIFNGETVTSNTTCVTAGSGTSTALRLTTNAGDQSGSAWFTAAQPISGNFSTSFTFRLGGSTGTPGDGFAFVIQNSPAGTAALDADNGTDGCSLGFGEVQAEGANCTATSGGIPNSLAVGFDIYQNTDINDVSSDHIEVQSCGQSPNTVDSTCRLSDFDLSALETPIVMSDGNPHSATITYTASAANNCGDSENLPCSLLDVTIDGVDVTHGGVNFAMTSIEPEGGGTSAYVGFTAATGGANDNQDILAWAFNQQQVQTSNTPVNQQPQSFTFSSTPNQVDIYSFDYSNAPTLQNTGGTPTIDDLQVKPTDWAAMVYGTPFATTQCIAYASAGGNCVAHRQLCSQNGNTPSGAQCPSVPTDSAPGPNPSLSPSLRYILFNSTLDPSTATFPNGTVFGAVEATDNWTGLTCQFPADAADAALPCPQNGLVSYTGPGGSTGSVGTISANSTYYLTTGGLLPTTTATGFVNAAGWANSANPMGTFTSTPPALPVPNSNAMVIAPIANIGYGWNPSSSGLPSTLLPVPGDKEVDSTTTCPNPITSSTPALPFSSGLVSVGPLTPDGSYLLHYSSNDCAGNVDLLFALNNNNPPSWTTNYRSLTINVDTNAPAVTGISFSPSTLFVNQPVTVTYSCSDTSTGSGLSTCGGTTFTPAGTPLVGPFNAGPYHATFTPTSTGSLTYPITATDVAGNSVTVNAPYTVVNLPDDLAIFDLGPLIVATGKTGGTAIYGLGVINNGPNSASNVVVTDTLPAGTTLGSAFYAVVSCSKTGCSVPTKGNNCTSSGNPVVVSCPIGSLGVLKSGTGAGVAVTVKVPTTLKGKKIVDSAGVSSLNQDTNSKNNTASFTTLVQ